MNYSDVAVGFVIGALFTFSGLFVFAVISGTRVARRNARLLEQHLSRGSDVVESFRAMGPPDKRPQA